MEQSSCCHTTYCRAEQQIQRIYSSCCSASINYTYHFSKFDHVEGRQILTTYPSYTYLFNIFLAHFSKGTARDFGSFEEITAYVLNDYGVLTASFNLSACEGPDEANENNQVWTRQLRSTQVLDEYNFVYICKR